MKRYLLTVSLIVVFAFLFASCGESPAKEDSIGDIVTVIESGETTPEETGSETSEKEIETEKKTGSVSSRPEADGLEVKAYDITFYLPKELTANEWNGMLGVYDYYTGEYVGSAPTGLDITLVVSGESAADGDLPSFAQREIYKNFGIKDVFPESSEFNGKEWLKYRADDGRIYYCAIFNEGVYEIVAKPGGEETAKFEKTVEMMEKTLYFEIAE